MRQLCGLCRTPPEHGVCPSCGAWVDQGRTRLLDQIGDHAPVPHDPPVPQVHPGPDLSRFRAVDWAQPTSPAPTGGQPGSGWSMGRIVAILMAATLGLVLVIVVVVKAAQPGSEPATPAPATSIATSASSTPSASPTTSPSPTPSATPTPTALPESQAKRMLDAEAYRYSVTTDNHVLVELSAKWVGATDPQLTAANGTHTFYASDIWTEYQNLRDRFGPDTHLVNSTSFGKQAVNPSVPYGQQIYVVIHDPRTFTSTESATAFCQQVYPGWSGDALENLCHARTASPPH